MKIEWFYCITIIKVVGEARARTHRSIDPDGRRGLKFEGVLSPEPHALCPGLRLSSYLPSWLFIVSKVAYTGSSTIVYRIERYEISWSKLLLMN